MTRRSTSAGVTAQCAAVVLCVSVSTVRRLLQRDAFPHAFGQGEAARIPIGDLQAYKLARFYNAAIATAGKKKQAKAALRSTRGGEHSRRDCSETRIP